MVMTERRTRGRQSKIMQLPDHIKAQLDAMLREGYPQTAILAHINVRLENEGVEPVSYSSLNRYSTNMESIGREIREMREVADVWVAQLGSKPTGEMSKLLVEMLRGQVFKLMTETFNDPESVIDPGMVKDLALGIQRLENAALSSHKREKEIRKAFAEEAAKEVEAAAVSQGLTQEGVKAIKEQILGIA